MQSEANLKDFAYDKKRKDKIILRFKLTQGTLSLLFLCGQWMNTVTTVPVGKAKMSMTFRLRLNIDLEGSANTYCFWYWGNYR